MLRRRLFCLAVSALVSGCASGPQNTTQPDQVATIFASLKCAFAKALVEERSLDEARRQDGKRPICRLRGRLATGTLTVKLEYAAAGEGQIKGAAGAGGPFHLAALGAAPGSIIPSFSSGNKRTDAMTTKLPFQIVMEAKNAAVCERLENKPGATALSKWLANVIINLNAHVDYEPRGRINSIEMTQDFAVVKNDKAGADVNLVFISASLGSSRETKDNQNLTFTIAANPYAKGDECRPRHPEVSKKETVMQVKDNPKRAPASPSSLSTDTPSKDIDCNDPKNWADPKCSLGPLHKKPIDEKSLDQIEEKKK